MTACHHVWILMDELMKCGRSGSRTCGVTQPEERHQRTFAPKVVLDARSVNDLQPNEHLYRVADLIMSATSDWRDHPGGRKMVDVLSD